MDTLQLLASVIYRTFILTVIWVVSLSGDGAATQCVRSQEQ